MLRTRVGVLRGGPSHEFDVSLATGKVVLDNLPEDKYRPIDIFVDQKGEWHRGGIPVSPERAIFDIDVVFNALHGKYGEDGKVQQLLELYKIPYTGSGALASAIGMNKALAKKYLLKNGIKTPQYHLLEISPNLQNELIEIFRTTTQPSVVKPLNSGSSLGVSLVRSFDELCRGVANAFSYSPQIMIEEYILGREGTLGVINKFRDKWMYPLLPVEIRLEEGKDVFDYDSKFSGSPENPCPGDFSKVELAEIQKLVLLAHEALNMRHYSRTDFIIHPKRGIYILEVNTLPGLGQKSPFVKALSTLDIKLPEFLSHIVSLALARK